ncbi:GH32 C-terminal domain-containing protein [Kribbella sp. NPDC049584]|uniref:GH32 C-terminal domain-containing protein n=1 Tax=Kribbella sp. NPDC049584 TaxID=3154833 RepID=UPI00342B2D83
MAGSDDSRWVLVRGDGRYSIGSFDGRTFVEETSQLQVDGGPHFYATQSWAAGPALRRVQVAWMRGGHYPNMPFNQQVSIPCDLSLHHTAAGLRMFRKPIPKLATLQRTRHTWPARVLSPGSPWQLGTAWPLLRITCNLTLAPNSELMLNICGTQVAVTSATIAILTPAHPTTTPPQQPTPTAPGQPTTTSAKQPPTTATKQPAPTAANEPTATVTGQPTTTAAEQPSATLTGQLAATPPGQPTATPSEQPSVTPTGDPTVSPTEQLTATAAEQPTATPTGQLAATPTEQLTATPTEQPSATAPEQLTATATGQVAAAAVQATITAVRRIDIVVDTTSVEVFANDGEASLTACVLPGHSELTLTASGADCTLSDLEVVELASIWPSA